jgi:hypothetical protein
VSKAKTAGIVTITVIATAVIVGGGIYVWQQQVMKTQTADYEQQLTDARAQARVATDSASKTTTPATSTPVANTTIVYVGDVAAPAADKDPLQTKVADPFFAFYNETTTTYVAMNVQTPVKTGDPYKITAIGKSGTANLSFTQQKKGAVTEWIPDCGTAGCKVSDTFRQKYPDIAAKIKTTP